MDGVIIVNKEKGWTSQDVCAKLRGVLGQKKIGHTGTLDPDATGVLPVLLGKATKLSDILTAEQKVYETTLKLGIETTTLDMSGEIISEEEIVGESAEQATEHNGEQAGKNNAGQAGAKIITEAAITEAIKKFTGDIDQVPPMYSAIKVDGKKLYELAREGIEIERKSRRITIKEIEILDINIPFVTMRVHCSKGTYIRTLCDDIGKALGTHAAMCELTRLRSGDFNIEDAFTIEEIEELASAGKTSECILPIEEVLRDMPTFVVEETYRKALENGNLIDTTWGHGDIYLDGTLVYSDDDRLIGIYKLNKEGKLKPYKMLL